MTALSPRSTPNIAAHILIRVRAIVSQSSVVRNELKLIMILRILLLRLTVMLQQAIGKMTHDSFRTTTSSMAQNRIRPF